MPLMIRLRSLNENWAEVSWMKLNNYQMIIKTGKGKSLKVRMESVDEGCSYKAVSLLTPLLSLTLLRDNHMRQIYKFNTFQRHTHKHTQAQTHTHIHTHTQTQTRSHTQILIHAHTLHWHLQFICAWNQF